MYVCYAILINNGILKFLSDTFASLIYLVFYTVINIATTYNINYLLIRVRLIYIQKKYHKNYKSQIQH